MSYMQPFCPNGNRKLVYFGSKVEFTKMRTNKCYVCFFPTLNKRAVTIILELNEPLLYTLVKFEYWSTTSKNEGVFEKTNMISCLFFRK